jgi:hypothetical protein
MEGAKVMNISNSEQLKSFLDKLFESPEAMPIAEEPKPEAAIDGGADNVSISNASGSATTPSKKNVNITLSMIIDKINEVRSGHSMKDPVIYRQMHQYYNKLNDTERLALFAFLKGIAYVVTREVKKVAAAPSSTAPEAVAQTPAAPEQQAPSATPPAPATKQEAPAAQETIPAAAPSTAAAPPVNKPSPTQKVRTIKPTIVKRKRPPVTPIKPVAR